MRQWTGHLIEGGLGAHAQAWDALNAARFNSHPLLDSRFWNGLLRHFGAPGVQLWILQGDDGPEAMCLLHRQGWGRWTTYLPRQAQLGPVMVSDSTMVDELLLALRPMALQLDLLAIDPDVCTFDPHPQQRVRVVPHAMTMNVRVDGNFATYWNARSANLKKNLRRYEKANTEANLDLRHQVVTSPDAVVLAIDRYAQLETAGWKGSEGTALAPGNQQTRFYAEWLRSAAAGGAASVHELWNGDKLAASRLMVHGGAMMVILKTTYDETLSACSPSWQLLRLVLQHTFDAGHNSRVEFYTNAHHGQLPWATGTRTIRHLSYFREDASGAVLHAILTLRRLMSAGQVCARVGAQAKLTVSCHPVGDAWPKAVSALFERTALDNLQVNPDWYDNMVQTLFTQQADVTLWVMREGQQVVAALPVRIDRARLGCELQPLGHPHHTALYTPALAPNLAPDRVAVLIRHLVQHYRGLGRLTFEPMDPNSDGFRTLTEALEIAGLVCFKFFRFVNWYLPRQTGYADYLKSRSANLRSTVKRMKKRCADEGGQIEIVTEPHRLPVALAAYWQVYKASWKQDEPFPGFVDGLAKWTAARGYLRLGLIWLDGQPIAAQFWLVADGKCEIVKVAYDEAYKKLSPGTVLTAALLEHVLDSDGVTEVDFLIGDDEYKRHWMSARRERWGIAAFNPATLGGLLGALGQQLAEASRRWRLRHINAESNPPCRPSSK